MRGTRVCCDGIGCRPGIIPAYAGNTATCTPADVVRRDHPRVCGEHMPFCEIALESEGSSPRMRGTRLTHYQIVFCPGIIPAYAGNTVAVLYRDFMHGDHPRVCGEHQQAGYLVSANTGSSPRMRGTHYSACCRACWHGIIPAYAGNTQTGGPRRTTRGDHPRVCGEHATVSESGAVTGGIIPAYAGNTSKPPSDDSARRDHPRVCGEH